MNLTIANGRDKFYQWDLGQKLIVDDGGACNEVHFAGGDASCALVCKILEVDGLRVVEVPNQLLQNHGTITAYLFWHDKNGALTNFSKSFLVLRRKRPESYLITETETINYSNLLERLEQIERDGVSEERITDVVWQYMEDHPITAESIGALSANQLSEAVKTALTDAKASGMFNGKDGETGPQGEKGDTGAEGYTPVRGMDYWTDDDKTEIVEEVLEQVSAGGLSAEQIAALDNMFKVCAFVKADVSEEYTVFKTAFGISDSGDDVHTHRYSSSVTTAATCTTAGVRTYTCSCGHSYTQTIPATGHNYVDGVCTVCGAADPTYTPGVTLTSISATYSGGEVPVGTAVNSLPGIVVKAHYSDGTSETVTGYTLNGTIAEGSNIITVTYGGKTAIFTVTGVDDSGVSNETKWTDGVAYDYASVENEYINKSDGTFITYNGWCRTPHLYCAGASKLRIEIALTTGAISPGNEGNQTYNAFYDANKNFIQSFSFQNLDGSTEGAYFDVDIPANAAYFIVSHKHNVICDNNGYGKAYIDIIPLGNNGEESGGTEDGGETAVTLSSISATYNGGSVPVGTALTALAGIVVTAHYSDGSTVTVTDYTLSGTIAEGGNTITVSYGGMTTNFAVTGVAESGGEEIGVSNETTWTSGVDYTFTPIADEYPDKSTGVITAYSGWQRTPYLYCAGASTLRVTTTVNTSALSGGCSDNAFYDADKKYVGTFGYYGLNSKEPGYYIDIAIPENAAYFILSGGTGRFPHDGGYFPDGQITLTPYE